MSILILKQIYFRFHIWWNNIISCFALSAPNLPVYRGEIQALGMNIDSFDSNGKSLSIKKELVCKSAFPSMPLYFINDKDGSKYRKTYFEKYPEFGIMVTL